MSGQSCREALERVFEYLDNELAPADAAEMKRHFEKCRSCFPVLKYCQSFQDAMQRAADCQCCAPKELRDRIAELLKQ
jgi:mycothiol system anti-sigma-R factor